MARGRTRGNARKKKSRLTEHTLQALVDLGRHGQAERSGAATVERPDVEAAAPVEPAARPDALSFLDMLGAPDEAPIVPAAYNDAAMAYTGAADFPAGRYVFGIVMCAECRNEMMYYQDRNLLAQGYRFRCRVCQHELLAALD